MDRSVGPIKQTINNVLSTITKIRHQKMKPKDRVIYLHG